MIPRTLLLLAVILAPAVLQSQTASVDPVTYQHNYLTLFAQYGLPGNTVLTATALDAIVWDPATGAELCRCFHYPDALNGRIEGVALHPDGRRVLVLTTNGLYQIANLDTGTKQIVVNETFGAGDVQYGPDGNMVAVTRGDSVFLYSTSDWTLLQAIAAHSSASPRTTVRFSSDGARIVTTGTDSSVRVWSTMTGQRLMEARIGVSEGLLWDAYHTAHFTALDTAVVVVYGDIQILNATTGAESRTISTPGTIVSAAATSRDGRLIAIGTSDARIYVADILTAEPKQTLIGHAAQINALAFNYDGSRLLSASSDRSGKVWSIEASSGVDAPTAAVGMSVAVSPNPTRDGDVSVEVLTSRPGEVSVEAVDLTGRSVMPTVAKMVEAGRSEVRLNLGELAAGTYFVRVRADGHQSVRPIIVMR